MSFRFPVAYRIFTVIAIVLPAALAIGATAFLGLSALEDGSRALYSQEVQALKAVDQLAAQLDGGEEAAVLTALAAGSPSKEAELRTEFEDEIEPAVAQDIDGLRRLYAGRPARLDQVDELAEGWDDFVQAYEHGREFAAPGGDALAAADAVDAKLDPLKAISDDLVVRAERAAAARNEANKRAAGQARTMVGVAIALAVLALALVFGWLVRSIVPRIRRYSEFAGTVARHDLSTRIEPKGNDELTDLGRHLNSMVDDLADVSGRMHAGAQTISTSAAEIMATVDGNSAAAQSSPPPSRRPRPPSRRCAPRRSRPPTRPRRCEPGRGLGPRDRGGQPCRRGHRVRHGDISQKVDQIARTSWRCPSRRLRSRRSPRR